MSWSKNSYHHIRELLLHRTETTHPKSSARNNWERKTYHSSLLPTSISIFLWSHSATTWAPQPLPLDLTTGYRDLIFFLNFECQSSSSFLPSFQGSKERPWLPPIRINHGNRRMLMLMMGFLCLYPLLELSLCLLLAKARAWEDHHCTKTLKGHQWTQVVLSQNQKKNWIFLLPALLYEIRGF